MTPSKLRFVVKYDVIVKWEKVRFAFVLETSLDIIVDIADNALPNLVVLIAAWVDGPNPWQIWFEMGMRTGRLNA